MNHDPLISQALLGSARMSSLPAAPVSELESIWPQWDPQQSASCLLSALAIVRSLHLAGRKTQVVEEEVPPCSNETFSYISSQQEIAGMRLLQGEYSELLGEWFVHTQKQSLLLPPRMLATVLPFGTKNKEYRGVLRSLCGERGLWLARQHDRFSWLLEEEQPDDDAWDQGLPAERVAWLHHMRQVDRERAMKAVMSQWAGEEMSMRESILQVILKHPTADDLEFLQQHASQDRRQEIRTLAFSALLQIEDSELRTRVRERVCQFVTWQNRQWVINAPTAYEKEWSKDGIKEKAPGGVGQRAWWLQQIIGLMPIQEWCRHWQTSATDLFSAPIKGDWITAVHQGWMAAARLVPSPDSLEPLITCLLENKQEKQDISVLYSFIQNALGSLDAERRLDLLESLCSKLPQANLLYLLSTHLSAFPLGKGKACLALIRDHVYNPKNSDYRPQARALALCIPLESIPAELKTLSQQPQLSSFAEEFAATLEFRQQLFSPTTPLPS